MIETILTALLCFLTGWVLGHFGLTLLGRAILDGKAVITHAPKPDATLAAANAAQVSK